MNQDERIHGSAVKQSPDLGLKLADGLGGVVTGGNEGTGEDGSIRRD